MGPMKLALRAPLFFAAALSLMAAQLPTAKPEEVGMSSERLQRITAMLRGFSLQERRDMIGDDGRIGVTCEFCSTHESFEPGEFDSSE